MAGHPQCHVAAGLDVCHRPHTPHCSAPRASTMLVVWASRPHRRRRAPPDGDCAGGHRADNRDKNRDVLIVPRKKKHEIEQTN